MELTHSITTEVSTEVEYFPLFSVESTPKGTLIQAKSELFAELLDSLGAKTAFRGEAKTWKDHTFHIPKGIRHVTTEYTNTYGLFLPDTGAPNLIWLFYGDLKEGISLLATEPLSLNNLEDWFTQSCEQLRAIYLNSIRKVKFTASLKEKKKAKKGGPVDNYFIQLEEAGRRIFQTTPAATISAAGAALHGTVPPPDPFNG